VLRTAPRIGVLGLATSSFHDPVREEGGRPVRLESPGASPRGGVVLEREWVADWFETLCSVRRLDGLLISLRRSAEELAGLLLAALRLDLPTVVTPQCERPFDFAPFALGFAPLSDDPAAVAVEVARKGGPRPRILVNEFSLAGALRAGLSCGGGPEIVVHLSAIARESGTQGFSQMLRVLTPDTPLLVKPDSDWFREHGVPGLLSHLGDAIHDTASVEGRVRETLPPAPPAPPPPADSRLVFVQGRASGTEAICRTFGEEEVSGECRVFDSETEAARAVEADSVVGGELLVVGGCGPRGGPGLLRLDLLAQTLHETGLEGSVAVVTDGLPSEEAQGTWISLVSPEAAAGGVIGRLRDGDTLRIDLAGGRIRTGVQADEMERRDPYEFPDPAGAGYAARYARSALSALEGAGFG
jgi:dihydroxy-acid dehydratase